MDRTWVRAPRLSVIFVVVLVGLAATGVRPSMAGEPPGNAMQSERAGVRAYIDPQTGAPGVPPPGIEAPPSARAAGRRLTDVVEVPSTGSAGGVMVNTKGRFNADITAASNANGTATVHCAPDQSAHSSVPADRHP